MESNPQLSDHLLYHSYELIKRIGGGATASVFLIKSMKYSGELFVAKYIPMKPSSKSTPKIEVDVLLSLDHPNIINVYESFTEDNIFYIILEYCPGGSIKDHLLKDKKISGMLLHSYASQLVSAIKYCHSFKIAHRDIKPANLLLDRYGRLKLADFGLSQFAKNSNDGDDDDESSGGVNACGTPIYMAPEMLTQEKDADMFKSDIWSLGVTLYEMAVGQKPWNGTINELKAQMQFGIEKTKKISSSLYKLIKAMLNPNPSKRVSIDTVMNFDYFTRKNVWGVANKKSNGSTFSLISNDKVNSRNIPNHNFNNIMGDTNCRSQFSAQGPIKSIDSCRTVISRMPMGTKERKKRFSFSSSVLTFNDC